MTFLKFSGTMNEFRSRVVRVPPWLLARGKAGVERDRSTMGGVAILAALVGESGAAASAVTQAGVEISAVVVEFEMGGRAFIGLLSQTDSKIPFNESDQVDVIAEVREGESIHEVKAIARPSDRLIVLPPHCSRGRRAYARRAVIRISIVSVIAALAAGWFAFGSSQALFASPTVFVLSVASGVAALYAFIEHRGYLENSLPYVHLTEQVFSSLGFADVQGIDLIRVTKATRTATELPGYGWSFYRY